MTENSKADRTNKSERVLALHEKLRSGKGIKKEEEAKRYGVDVKSIERDIDVIKSFLSDRQAETGEIREITFDRKRGEYILVTRQNSKFTKSEILAISKILLESRAFTKKEMDELMEKLLSCCVPEENYKIVKQLILNEQHHYVEPHHKTVFVDKMWELGVAIKEHKVIHISYKKLKGEEVVERKLQPMAIMFSEFYFYLVGFIMDIDKEKAFQNPNDPFPTIYRIDRIQSLEVTEEKFRVKDSIGRFEEGEFRKRIQFMQGGKLRRIKFKYKGNSLEAVLDRLPTAEVVKEEEDGVVLQAEVFGEGVDMWLRMHSSDIEMVE
ncbi:MAG: WYL domain-containing protein [Lachnospiraceae bacterium]|nr:WYL domain-containing protein [Lachnospiraceae bacterium]